MRAAVLLALALVAGAACGGKKTSTTPAGDRGGAAYGGDVYGAGEPSGEPRPDPCGGDPCGY